MCVLCPPVVWSLPFLHLFAIFFSLALAMTKNKRRIIITISARPDYYYLDSYRTDYEYRDYIPTKKKKKAKKLFVLLAVEFEWRPILLRGGPRQFLSE